MAPATSFYRWSAKIQRDTLPELQMLADKLGFIVQTPGVHFEDPSPPKMLDALAEAHRRNPSGTTLALKVLLSENGLLPERPPATADAAE